MVCYHPLSAYIINFPDGQRKIQVVSSRFDVPVSDRVSRNDCEYFELPCGRCIGCRLEYSRQWAVRCMHEAQLHDKNCFLTLTYSDQFLPKDLSLHKEDLQKFWKRLRKVTGEKIRYFACGEYGSKFSRPHFHACVFGYKPDDIFLWSVRHGVRLFVSPTIAKLWPFGFHTIGEVNFESAAYVARYVLKKVTGENSKEHYQGRQPEFVCMSRRPGIASDWIRKYYDDVYPNDFIVVRDKFKCKPPRYYDNIYDVIEGNLDYIKNMRKDKAVSIDDDRLYFKELHKKVVVDQKLKRKFETNDL